MNQRYRIQLSQSQQVSMLIALAVILLAFSVNTGFAQSAQNHVPQGCTDGQVATWNGTDEVWECTDLPEPANPNPDPPCFDNDNRYVDCGNGTVTDTVTGLVWLFESNCLQGPALDWKTANEFAAELGDNQCGLADNSKSGDWRLPTKEEWETTMSFASPLVAGGLSCFPALTDTTGENCYTAANGAFALTLDVYWSSSSLEEGPSNAWFANIQGFVDSVSKSEDFLLAWPVRDGR